MKKLNSKSIFSFVLVGLGLGFLVYQNDTQAVVKQNQTTIGQKTSTGKIATTTIKKEKLNKKISNKKQSKKYDSVSKAS